MLWFCSSAEFQKDARKISVEACLSSVWFGFKYQNNEAFQTLNEIHVKDRTLLNSQK